LRLRVFFTASYAGKKRYQHFFDTILAAIRHESLVTTPEDTKKYVQSLTELQSQGLNRNQAHYAFIRQGIASADVVIIEATEEDIRVGHEMTLALLFHKPTLVLAQGKDFGAYITHDLLTGASYETAKQAEEIVQSFLQTSMTGRPEASMQTLDSSADSLHSIALARLRRLAKQEPGQFGHWAREAEEKPEQVAREIEASLGRLKKQPTWSVFAPIYNEDSPDYIQNGVATFIDAVLVRYGIDKDSLIVEAACGTGALSRQLSRRGYTRLAAFDNSRSMLAEAFKLSAKLPNIKLFEADIRTLHLNQPANTVVWTDYSSNFALDQQELFDMITRLVGNLVAGGLLIFDIRTYQGWQIDFYSQPVTTFATERFQRIWLNHQDRATKIIDFDVFIRTRDVDGAWSPWRRESMRERMWHLKEVLDVIAALPGVTLKAMYGEDFRELHNATEEPNLLYIVLEQS
jgi:SAM-dependent methyltransferase